MQINMKYNPAVQKLNYRNRAFIVILKYTVTVMSSTMSMIHTQPYLLLPINTTFAHLFYVTWYKVTFLIYNDLKQFKLNYNKSVNDYNTGSNHGLQNTNVQIKLDHGHLCCGLYFNYLFDTDESMCVFRPQCYESRIWQLIRFFFNFNEIHNRILQSFLFLLK